MPDPRRRTCQRCKRNDETCGPISWTGLCEECAVIVATENYVGLTTKSGPYFRHWRKQIAASVGGVLLDEPPRSE